MTASETVDRPMLITRDLRVNSYDVDFMGIVSNIAYIRWFEDLRFLFLDRYWPLADMMRDGLAPILSKTTAEYRAPLTIHDRPVGRLWAADMGRALWRVSLEIASENTVHCTGQQEGYIYDLARKRPVRMPGTLVDRFREESTLTP